MNPPSRRTPGSHGSPSSRIQPGAARAASPSTRRLGATPAPSSSSRSMPRPAGGAPVPAPRGGGAPKKDNTPMIVGGVAVGVLALVGLGFAMMGGDKTPPKKKEAAPAVKAKDPEKPGYDPWNDPSMMGSETDAAKRRKEGQKEQDKSGDVDRTKVDPGGGK